MKVKDYMQVIPVTVTPEELVSTAQSSMGVRRIRHLPVVDAQGKLVGVVTDRDIRRTGASDEPHMAEHELTYLLDKMTVKDIMTRQVVSAHGEMSVAEAGQIFLERKFGCLPVVRDDNTLEGIITITDLLRAYVEQHGTATSAS
jgi:acetoin utilization protein AcuB